MRNEIVGKRFFFNSILASCFSCGYFLSCIEDPPYHDNGEYARYITITLIYDTSFIIHKNVAHKECLIDYIDSSSIPVSIRIQGVFAPANPPEAERVRALKINFLLEPLNPRILDSFFSHIIIVLKVGMY